MRVLLHSGEPSGLLFAELLSRALTTRGVSVSNLASHRQRPGESVVGFWEGVRAAPALRRRLESAVNRISSASLDVVVLIGFPGFHVPLGRRCRGLGLPVVLVGPPQVWAWGRFRARALKQAADKVVCLFEFEEHLLREAGVDAVFLGYPLLDVLAAPRAGRVQVLAGLGLGPDAQYVAFLPGTRSSEVGFHRPLFARVARVIRRELPGMRAVLLGLDEWGNPLAGLAQRYDAIHHAECAVVVSGTATLETALLGTPLVATYHLSWLSRLAARALVRQRWFALPNILLAEPLVPELLEPRAEQLRREVVELLGDRSRRDDMCKRFQVLWDMLGPRGAVERIAGLVLALSAGGRARAIQSD